MQGGSDGVFIDAGGVHLKDCKIVGAACRGIFANHSFVIEGCTVGNCGSYGMKTRSGCERRGVNNSIQEGPWDSHIQWGDQFGDSMPFGFGGDDLGVDISQLAGLNLSPEIIAKYNSIAAGAGGLSGLGGAAGGDYGIGDDEFLLGGSSDEDEDDD